MLNFLLEKQQPADSNQRLHNIKKWLKCRAVDLYMLKVPKHEIIDRSNFPDFYAIKSSWVGDLLVKILT
jgi:hypothetical protein